MPPLRTDGCWKKQLTVHSTDVVAALSTGGQYVSLIALDALSKIIIEGTAVVDHHLQELSTARAISTWGAVHGFAGQALLLLRAFTLLSAERRASLRSAIARTLDATAVRDGKLVNWPTVAAPAEPPVCLVQFSTAMARRA